MCLPIVNLHLQLFLANHSTFCALCGHFLLTEFILGLNKSSSTREIISTRLVYRLRSIQYVSWIAICCDKIRKGFAARSMNPGKRKLRRRNSVFGRSKDDTFQITNKGRRKGANSQNRWVNWIQHILFHEVIMVVFPQMEVVGLAEIIHSWLNCPSTVAKNELVLTESCAWVFSNLLQTLKKILLLSEVCT